MIEKIKIMQRSLLRCLFRLRGYEVNTTAPCCPNHHLNQYAWAEAAIVWYFALSHFLLWSNPINWVVILTNLLCLLQWLAQTAIKREEYKEKSLAPINFGTLSPEDQKKYIEYIDSWMISWGYLFPCIIQIIAFTCLLLSLILSFWFDLSFVLGLFTSFSMFVTMMQGVLDLAEKKYDVAIPKAPWN